MNIFYLEWKGIKDENLCKVFEKAGHVIVRIPFEGERVTAEQMRLVILEKQKQERCDFVFSFDYFPEISACCMEQGLKYVSWICDRTNGRGYSKTVVNPCNYIFIFDYIMYEELRGGGVDTVYYLPLAVGLLDSTERAGEENVACNKEMLLPKQNVVGEQRVEKVLAEMEDFTRGYLDGVVQAQKQVRQHGFLEEMLTSQIMQELENAYPIETEESLLSDGALYADLLFYPYITVLEQREIKQLLHKYELAESGEKLTPAKININITPRNIKTGITQWAMEVMGQGGFLLSDYQQELFEYFEEGKDFVCYLDHEDLLAKVDYYLQHDEEREQIARNGYQKVLEAHTLQQRVDSMLEVFCKQMDAI